MGRLRRAPSTMAHNGKQSKCIGGFQGGSWSMWLMEGRVLMKVILRVVASLYGVNRYDSGRYIVYSERRREESKKSSKITVHWDHSGISCQNCPTAPHRHTRTQHTHTHVSILPSLHYSYYRLIENMMASHLQAFPSVKQSKLSSIKYPLGAHLACPLCIFS